MLVVEVCLTLGEVLDGDRMALSLYDIGFKSKSNACCGSMRYWMETGWPCPSTTSALRVSPMLVVVV